MNEFRNEKKYTEEERERNFGDGGKMAQKRGREEKMAGNEGREKIMAGICIVEERVAQWPKNESMTSLLSGLPEQNIFT